MGSRNNKLPYVSAVSSLVSNKIMILKVFEEDTTGLTVCTGARDFIKNHFLLMILPLDYIRGSMTLRLKDE